MENDNDESQPSSVVGLVTVYVDGSYQEDSKRKGSGIWFGPHDIDNLYIPVPDYDMNKLALPAISKDNGVTKGNGISDTSVTKGNGISDTSVTKGNGISDTSISDSSTYGSALGEAKTQVAPNENGSTAANNLLKTKHQQPQPGFNKSGSIRAELYAATVALFVLQTRKFLDLYATPVIIKQDCMAAIILCKFVMTLPKSPSRWLIEPDTQAIAKEWKHTLSWDQTLTTQDLIDHADILDYWWLYTHRCYWIRLEWIPAHLDVDGQRKRKEQQQQQQQQQPAKQNDIVSKSANNVNKTLHQLCEQDRQGNKFADIYAKSAANLSVSEYLNSYLDFPLYPQTSFIKQ